VDADDESSPAIGKSRDFDRKSREPDVKQPAYVICAPDLLTKAASAYEFPECRIFEHIRHRFLRLNFTAALGSWHF
jgi:hypothetical protein